MQRQTVAIAAVLLTFFYIGEAISGTIGPDDQTIEKIYSVVDNAAKKIDIAKTDSMANAFVDIGLCQKDAVKKVYASVPKDEIVTRLMMYLSIKKDIANLETLTTRDLVDFNWGYLLKDADYSIAKFESPKAARLAGIQLGNIQYNFPSCNEVLHPGSLIVVPARLVGEGINMNATFKSGIQTALWTGPLAQVGLPVHTITVNFAETTQDCEIMISSQPSQATIYFNGKRWYRPTDTAVVQDPGTWEVKIHREGYKDWVDTRTLSSGESWTITAQLIK